MPSESLQDAARPLGPGQGPPLPQEHRGRGPHGECDGGDRVPGVHGERAAHEGYGAVDRVLLVDGWNAWTVHVAEYGDSPGGRGHGFPQPASLPILTVAAVAYTSIHSVLQRFAAVTDRGVPMSPLGCRAAKVTPITQWSGTRS